MATSRRFIVTELRNRGIVPSSPNYSEKIFDFLCEAFKIPAEALEDKEVKFLKTTSSGIASRIRGFMNLGKPNKATIRLDRVLSDSNHQVFNFKSLLEAVSSIFNRILDLS